MKKNLIIGAAMLDIVMQIERLPRTGEDVYAKSQEMKVGGCAYNVADIQKHFQVPYTLFAPVGTGIYADIIRKKLGQTGHESPIHSKVRDNGYCLCMVEADGERTFLTLPGIECRFEKEWFAEVDPKEYDSVYICGYEIEGEGGETIIEFLEENEHLIVYYAPGPRICHIKKERHERIFKLHPVLHLNEGEALQFTGEEHYEDAAEQLFEKCGNSVIITLGEKGCYLYQSGVGELIPSKKAQVVDTIGAGDTHIGAFIALRSKGKDSREAVALANQVSAMVVGVQGPTLTAEEFTRGDW